MSGRAPVLVGVGAVAQREDDPSRAREPVDLMADALLAAAEDAGSRELLARADRIAVPRGFWGYADPGRLVADRIGATRARTEIAEIGVLQTTLLGRAAAAIAAGEADVVLVTGGEAKYRTLRAAQTGVQVRDTVQQDVTPDHVLRPSADILHPLEIERGVPMPVHQYALIENALRHAEGTDLATHRHEVAALWARFNEVARTNPMAWSPEPLTPEEIAEPSDRNRMLAFPYTKRHNSQWNVDQAGGLVFCSEAVARDVGIPEDRWVHPAAVAESNHMVPLLERRLLHRSPGFGVAGRRLFDHAGGKAADVAHLELYSCFPVAVRVQARELGIDEGRPLTVTGGMAFAGGPLNNFVIQALVRMVETLRRAPGSRGLVNAVSGVITKQGLSLWSSVTPPRPFRHEDASDEVAEATEVRSVDADAVGPATVAACTVVHVAAGPLQGVAICDLGDGQRTIATTMDPASMSAMETRELAGRPVRVGAGGALEID